MKKKIYYDALFIGLVEVTDVKRLPKTSHWTEMQGIVAKTKSAYKKGERITGFARNFVYRVKDSTRYPAHIMVKNIDSSKFEEVK